MDKRYICAAYRSKSGRLFVGSGAVNVDILMSTVQVSGDDNWFFGLQLLDKGSKFPVPAFDAVVQPLQPILACIWRLPSTARVINQTILQTAAGTCLKMSCDIFGGLTLFEEKPNWGEK